MEFGKPEQEKPLRSWIEYTTQYFSTHDNCYQTIHWQQELGTNGHMPTDPPRWRHWSDFLQSDEGPIQQTMWLRLMWLLGPSGSNWMWFGSQDRTHLLWECKSINILQSTLHILSIFTSMSSLAMAGDWFQTNNSIRRKPNSIPLILNELASGKNWRALTTSPSDLLNRSLHTCGMVSYTSLDSLNATEMLVVNWRAFW